MVCAGSGQNPRKAQASEYEVEGSLAELPGERADGEPIEGHPGDELARRRRDRVTG